MSSARSSSEVLARSEDVTPGQPWRPGQRESQKQPSLVSVRRSGARVKASSRRRGDGTLRTRVNAKSSTMEHASVGDSRMSSRPYSVKGRAGGAAERRESSKEASRKHVPVSGSRNTPMPVMVVPLSYVVISDPMAVPSAVQKLGKKSRIAVDCEGVLLSRTGRLCLIQVASEEAVYMFDVAVGGPALFDNGLRGLLESSTCVKVLHDCRHDCDALMHQFNVKLGPVVDTQIAFSVLRAVRNLKVGFPVSLKTLLRKFVHVAEEDMEMKDSIKKIMQEREDFWLTRPIPAEALQYARFDVMYLLHLAKVLAGHISSANVSGWERVLQESDSYSRLFRDDSEGPRKEASKWAKMLTEASRDKGASERSKVRDELKANDPICAFKFQRDLITQPLTGKGLT